MKFNILSIFPEIVENFTNYSLLKRAKDKGILSFNFLNIRNFCKDKHRQVDDEPYGGGSGMVMKPEPVVEAISSLKDDERGKVILLSAKGFKFNQQIARLLSKENSITIICGRYEGIDERVNNWVDLELTIGDYVIMGGEVGACVLIEAISRLIPGVVGKEESIKIESYQDIFLEYPQYTRPQNFKGYKVPEILLSGNHQKINEWRKKESIKVTVDRRIDLIKNRERGLNQDEVEIIKKNLREKFKIYVALIHYPVYNKKKEIVSTAITNMDIHDISRVCRTYGVKKYFLVTPDKEQKNYALRVINHWTEGYGSEFNPSRKEALKVIDIKNYFEEVVEEIEKREKEKPLLIGTSAKVFKKTITYKKLWEIAQKKPILLVFGTGWGLTESIKEKMDYMLEPIYGLTDFNHLSVRSAVSIIIDRILGF